MSYDIKKPLFDSVCSQCQRIAHLGVDDVCPDCVEEEMEAFRNETLHEELLLVVKLRPGEDFDKVKAAWRRFKQATGESISLSDYLDERKRAFAMVREK